MDLITPSVTALIGRVSILLLSAVFMGWLWQVRRGRGEAMLAAGWALLAVGAVGSTIAFVLVQHPEWGDVRTALSIVYLAAQYAALPCVAGGLLRVAMPDAPGPTWARGATLRWLGGAAFVMAVVLVLGTAASDVPTGVRVWARVKALSLVQGLTFLGVAWALVRAQAPADAPTRRLVVTALVIVAVKQGLNVGSSEPTLFGPWRLFLMLGEGIAWLGLAIAAVMLVVDRDRTAALAALARLADADARAASRLATGHDLLWDLDAERRVIFASPSVERVLALAPAEVLGQPLDTMVHPEDMASCRAALDTALAEGTAPPTILRWRHGHGGIRWLETQHVRAPAGNALHLVSRDVSDRRQAEVMRLRAVRLETIQRIAGGVAHDFNGLMTGVLLGTDEVRVAVAPGSMAAQALDDIAVAARRGEALTRQLQAFAVPQDDGVVTQSVRDMLDAQQPVLIALVGARHGLAVHANQVGNACIRMAQDLLQQVLLSLAEYSMQRLHATGLVDLAAFVASRAGPDGTMHDWVCLRFRAIGAPAAGAVGAAGTPTVPGPDIGPSAGLAMLVSQQLVEQAGGHLTLHPVGETTAELWLPVVVSPEPVLPA